jgi:hypothetical protein
MIFVDVARRSRSWGQIELEGNNNLDPDHGSNGGSGLDSFVSYTQDNLTSSRMATSWIATLFPCADDFRLALRSLFDRWLGESARQRGFVRWDFKEVRLGATEAYLLHCLFPPPAFSSAM